MLIFWRKGNEDGVYSQARKKREANVSVCILSSYKCCSGGAWSNNPKSQAILPPKHRAAAPAPNRSTSRSCRLPSNITLLSQATSALELPQQQQKPLRGLWTSSTSSQCPPSTPPIISEPGDDSSPPGDSISNPGLTSLSDKPGSQPRRPLEHLKCQKEKNELQTEEALQTTPNPDSSLRDKERKAGLCAVVAFLPAIEWKLDRQNWQLWKTRLVV